MSDLDRLTAALARPLPHRARAGDRRDGDRLPRARTCGTSAASRSRCCGPTSRPSSAPSGSSTRSGSPPTSSTRTSCRCTTRASADGLLFYVMPYVQGESLRDRLEPREAAADRRGGAPRAGGRERARLRAPPGRHPSGHQAREHPAPGRHRAGDRLRHRAGGEPGRRHAPHRDRAVARHAVLHEPGAGDRRPADRRAERHLRARRRAVRDAERRPAAHRLDGAGGDRRGGDRGAARHLDAGGRASHPTSRRPCTARSRSCRPTGSRARPSSREALEGPTVTTGRFAAAPAARRGARRRWVPAALVLVAGSPSALAAGPRAVPPRATGAGDAHAADVHRRRERARR